MVTSPERAWEKQMSRRLVISIPKEPMRLSSVADSSPSCALLASARYFSCRLSKPPFLKPSVCAEGAPKVSVP